MAVFPLPYLERTSTETGNGLSGSQTSVFSFVSGPLSVAVILKWTSRLFASVLVAVRTTIVSASRTRAPSATSGGGTDACGSPLMSGVWAQTGRKTATSSKSERRPGILNSVEGYPPLWYARVVDVCAGSRRRGQDPRHGFW